MPMKRKKTNQSKLEVVIPDVINEKMNDHIRSLGTNRRAVVNSLLRDFFNGDLIQLGVNYVEHLKDYSEKNDVSYKTIVENLIDKYLPKDDKSAIIVLNIPNQLTEDRPQLEEWLSKKSTAILNHLTNKPNKE